MYPNGKELSAVDLTVVRQVELIASLLRIKLELPMQAAVDNNLLSRVLSLCITSPDCSLLHSASTELLTICLDSDHNSSLYKGVCPSYQAIERELSLLFLPRIIYSCR